MTRHPYLPFLLLWLIALLTPAGAEPLVEGRVRLDSGQPAAGAQVLLFDLADLRSPPVAAMTDERGWFALPSAAFPGRAVPERFELGANYPNPFNPSTIIPYQLPAPMHVRLAVFNVLGQRIATLVDGARPAGSHTATWEATDAGGRAVAAGVYLYRLSGSGRHMTRRMVLIDGQAGVAVAVPGGSASAGAEFPEADKVYGLTVSGQGLATYVDPAFRAEAGMAPLDIVVETPRSPPRAKAAAAAILGDVDNNGRVDIFDALLIAVYSANPALVMPNNGDIALGDVNRDGRTDLTDAYHIATYTVNPSDPTLPAGIGEAPAQQPPTQQPPTPGTAASKLYWTDWGTDKIQRADLDGSNVEDLVTTGLDGPDGLSLDAAGGKIYWADAGTNKIRRSNLDGSGAEDLVTGLGIPYGLALDVSGGKMYWTNRQTGTIQRSNLDGSGAEDLVTSGLTFPGALALDTAGGKMYWTNPGATKIQRSNLSGSSVEDLVTSGLSSPTGLALDVAGGMMYWTDRGTDKIQRSNLSGANVEDLVTSGLNSPNGLALDVAGGKMYWADAGTDKVQRANLNGSGVEDLITSADGLVDPSGIALGFGTDSQSGAGPAQATASLSPLPSTVSFLDDGAWHRFTVQASVPVVVVANPGGTTPRVEINNLSNTNYCPPEANDDLTRQDGQTLVLAGCSPGTGTVELRRASDQTVLQTYTFTIQTQDTGGGGGGNAPDLIVDAPTVSSGSPTAGASFILRATVRNQGSGRSAWTTLRYYRSTDATVDTSDTEVGTDYVTRLSASGTSAESISLPAPSAGTYYYGACVESVSGESNTGNNCSSAVTVTVGAGPMPDLIVDAPTVSSSSPTAGASFTLRATVRNQGSGRSAWTTLRYYRSTDATVDTSDTEVGTDDVTSLSASRTSPESIFLRAPSSAGTYYYGACVESVSGETNTGNNCSSAVTVTVPGTVTQPDPQPSGASKLYWSDWGTDKIQRADLDGSNVEDLVSGAGLDGPDGLSLDLAGGKIYWADAGTNKIQRSNLDGSEVEDLVTGLGIPYGLALDVSGGKMYWTNRQTGKIQRANLDGSGVEDLVTSGLTFPGALALDVAGGKIYWTNPGATKIQRASLSGSNVEDLVTSGLSSPTGLALDVAGGKIYWTDRGTDKIQRANLSGSNVEDLVTSGLNSPNGLALDVAGGKIYWTDAGTNKVQRANLNGSGVEDLLTSTDGLVDPSGIAIGGSAGVTPDTEVDGGGGGATQTRTAFESSNPSGYTRITLDDGGQVWGVPTKYTTDTNTGTVAYMVLGSLKGCAFANAEADGQRIVYVKTQSLGRLSNFESDTVCRKASRQWSSSWSGLRITHIRFFDESSPTNVSEAVYNASTGQIELGGGGGGSSGDGGSSGGGGGGGTSSAPDLVVDAPTVTDSSPTAGASFILRATVRNQGSGRSAWTTLRYYRSTDATVTTGDTEVGTDAVIGLSASRTSAQSISLRAPSSAGTYYYGACVESVSDESDTGNNCSSAVTVTVGAAPTPDLVVGTPRANPSTPTAGASFILSATVENQGSGQSASTTLRFYRSTDATISSSDTQLDTDSVPLLGPGGGYVANTNPTAPSSAGTYYYGACVESVSGESDTGNNCSSAVTVTVGAAPTPDLVVGTPRANPSTPTAGASFILSATVENQGSGQSASTILRFYRSTDATISTSDPAEAGSHPVGGLAASRTSAHSTDLTAPSSAGTYYYGACVESVSGESDTGNNCSSAVAVTVGAAPAPDLIVDAPTVSTNSPTAGASFTLSATVRNQGSGQSASTILRFYRSTDATISTSDPAEAGSHPVGGLAASRTSAHSTDLTAPSSAGTYYYGACVESVSGESDTGNNCSSAVAVTVGAAPTPDLVVGTPRANPSTPTAGASFILSATVENQGSGQSASTTLRFYRSTDAAISTSDTQEPGSHPVGGLAASGTSDHSANLTAPSSAGTYYYGACVESVSGESDTGNNCSSAVTVTVAETTTEEPETPPAGASKLYWSDWGTDKIQRADLDGSNVEDLVSGAGLNGPDGLSLDLAGGKIYWADAGTNKIQRANLDGSGVEDLVTGLGIPYGLGLDVAGGKMYWTNRQTGKIQRANLDGSGVEDLVTSGLTFPGALALDVAGGKMYWTNPGATKIQRADLSGSNVEDLVTSGLSSPLGLALDVAGGKMYWTDRGADKIQRADLSGSNVEDLVTSGLNSPNGLALDVTGGKMYWTDEGTNKVQRANLNGSGVEDLLTSSDGLVDPSGIALGGESASSSNGGSNTYGVGDALPDVPTGFFVPTRLAGGASLTSSGGTTTITFDNGGQMELQNGTTYTCIASGGCTVENGRVTMGLFE